MLPSARVDAPGAAGRLLLRRGPASRSGAAAPDQRPDREQAEAEQREGRRLRDNRGGERIVHRIAGRFLNPEAVVAAGNGAVNPITGAGIVCAAIVGNRSLPIRSGLRCTQPSSRGVRGIGRRHREGRAG